MVLLLLLLLLDSAELALLLHALLEVHLGVPLLLVGPGELAAADVAAEGFLPRVRADVRRQVVRPRERAHTDAALEWLLTRVDADVPADTQTPT